MRFRRIGSLGCAAALAAAALVTTTGAAQQAPGKLEKIEWMSRATHATKITQFVDEKTGAVVLEATTALDDVVVPSVNAGTGQVSGFDIVPGHEPKTDEEAAQMAEALTSEVIDERRKGVWRKDEMVPLPPQASDVARNAVNRAAPFGGTLADGGNSGKYVFSTGCAEIDGDELYARACFQRQRIPESDDDHRYELDSSWSSGHHRGFVGALRWIKTRHNYYNGHWSVTVVDWKPRGRIAQGACETFTMGLDKGPVQASGSTQACPEEINMNIEDELFMHGWFGKLARDNYWTGSVGHSVPRVNNGESMGWRFQMRACEMDWVGCDIDYGDRTS